MSYDKGQKKQKKKFDVEVEAAALPSDDVVLGVPVYILIAEGQDTATFFDANWASKVDPKSKRIVVAGLDTCGEKLPSTTGDEIRALLPAAQASNIAYAQSIEQRAGTAAMM